MICRRCIRARLGPKASIAPIYKRLSSTGPTSSPQKPLSNSTAQTSTARTASGSPAALSTLGVSQPLSSPLSPSPANTDAEFKERPKKKPKVVTLSSVPAGTPLKGLNFMKDGADPVALEDSAYPEWLWTVLVKKKDGANSGTTGDLFAKSKKQRRLAAKQARKEALLNPGKFAPRVPLHEQSIDLPAGDGTLVGAVEAEASREGLTKAMREQRRAKIKETNYLKSMG